MTDGFINATCKKSESNNGFTFTMAVTNKEDEYLSNWIDCNLVDAFIVDKFMKKINQRFYEKIDPVLLLFTI